jgi:hypothetical protein
MMSEGLDPSLELQQLASQALQYSTGQSTSHDQHQFLQNDFPTLPFDDVTSLSPDQQAPPDAKFACPFPTCNRHYKRKDLLKRHLTTLSASPDEHHQDTTVWDHIRDTGMMTIYTRPRNLSEEQKKLRRKESNLRHRVKYATELKEKRNRKRRVEKLLEGRQVGVQTPDWEEEARVAAAAAQATLNPELSGIQTVHVELSTVEPAINATTSSSTTMMSKDAPVKTGRRNARKQ